MSFATALSEHPYAAEATGEVVGEVLDRLGGSPDLAVFFLTGPHVARFDDVALAMRETLRPGTLAGTTAVSVVGGEREVEEQPAITLWAARIGPVRTARLDAVRTGDGWMIVGLDEAQLAATSTLLLFADPASFPADEFVDTMARDHPSVTVIGGMASAGFGQGANRFALDDAVHDDGAVAVLLDEGQPVTTVVSQGCRPVGEPLVVTRSEGNVISEIAGKPALERLQELFEGLAEDERAMVQQGLHIGRVIDEHRLEFGRGDFLVRNVIGGDRDTGALVVGEAIAVGTTVQFQVRDAASADEDLQLLLVGHDAAAALLFTCNGRGVRLFGRPDHDAELVCRSVTGNTVAGMFCAGEIGPVGGRSFLHGFTASIALFEAR